MDADLVVYLTQFCRALRNKGVPVVIADEIDATTALGLVQVTDRAEVHRALLISLKIRPRDRDRFDVLFAAWWTDRHTEDARPAHEHRRRTPPRGTPIHLPTVERMHVEQPHDELDVPQGDTPAYSSHPLLKRKSFDECSEEDLAEMANLAARMAVRLATRRSRRLVPTRGRGLVDLRRSLRSSVTTSGELFSLARRERPVELPRVVLLCDTSGSMDPHTRFLLTFVLSLGRVIRSLEVFAFNTTLTRITRWLRRRGIRETLDRLSAEVPDWSGGTRIGECLAEFVRDYASSIVTNKTIVVILSDGLDRGDPEGLVRALRSIHGASRRVLWLNPLMGDPRYKPTARGMAAALPFIDQLAAAHNLESLERIIPSLAA